MEALPANATVENWHSTLPRQRFWARSPLALSGDALHRTRSGQPRHGAFATWRRVSRSWRWEGEYFLT